MGGVLRSLHSDAATHLNKIWYLRYMALQDLGKYLATGKAKWRRKK